MKKAIATLLVLSATVVLAIVVANGVRADVASDVQRAEIIRAACGPAQSTLQNVSRSDAVTRLSRGRTYEDILKLMVKFNARVALNNYSQPDLAATTAEFEKELNAFRADYLTYEDAVSNTINTDCTNQPVTFYEALQSARSGRAKMQQHVKRLNQLMNQYQKEVDNVAREVGGDSEK